MENENNPPVAVSGMYRSGTSIFWRILSADSRFHKRFYEPLHSLLIDKMNTNPAMEEFSKDPAIMELWSPRFNFERIHLSKDDSYPELYSYLRTILVPNSLTKFTRTSMRISWLSHEFPQVFIINLIRDPRAVCMSYMRRGNIEFFLNGKPTLRERYYALRYMINHNLKFKPIRVIWNNAIDKIPARRLHLLPSVNQRLKGIPCRSIYCHQHYLDYLTEDPTWRDVARFAKTKSPQIAILTLWRINVLQSLKDFQELDKRRGISIRFEDFIEDPEATLRRVYQRMGIDSVPTEVASEINKRAESLKGIHRHEYDKKLSRRITQKWREIDDAVWSEAIEEAKIGGVMRKLRYSF